MLKGLPQNQLIKKISLVWITQQIIYKTLMGQSIFTILTLIMRVRIHFVDSIVWRLFASEREASYLWHLCIVYTQTASMRKYRILWRERKKGYVWDNRFLPFTTLLNSEINAQSFRFFWDLLNIAYRRVLILERRPFNLINAYIIQVSLEKEFVSSVPLGPARN